MKVVQIIPYMDTRFGGPVYVASSLSKFFKKLNIDALILSLDGSNNDGVIFFKKTTDKWFFSFDFLLNSIKYIKGGDVLVLHGIYTFLTFWTSLVAFILRKNIILIPHGMLDRNSVYSSSWLKNKFRYLYLKTFGLLTILLVRSIVFNSQKEIKNSFYSNFKKSILIPNGVDLEFIDSLACQNYYFNKNKIGVFYLGRLDKIKGIELLLEAVNSLNDMLKVKIELIIAGTGNSEYCQFLKTVSDKKIVKFVGHVEGEEKYCYLKQCDIYVQPSLTEGLSISMLEAMACKVSMITTNRVGLYEELLEKDAAKVVDYDSDKLKLAIIELINDKNKYRENCYKMIKEKYTWDAVLQDYIKLIGNK